MTEILLEFHKDQKQSKTAYYFHYYYNEVKEILGNAVTQKKTARSTGIREVKLYLQKR